MNTKEEFICGIPLISSSSEEAIDTIGTSFSLIEQVAMSEVIVCTPKETISISFLSNILPITFCLFIILGYYLGRHKSKKEVTQSQDILEEYSEE